MRGGQAASPRLVFDSPPKGPERHTRKQSGRRPRPKQDTHEAPVAPCGLQGAFRAPHTRRGRRYGLRGNQAPLRPIPEGGTT